ncbi:MAG: hypothetical protein JW884_04635 [Deltaproteobacteria bacterium]|nr:hypothetical protein [Deltaproteobacteria bacterium]
MAGGLARIAGVAQALRNEGKNVVLLDSGGLFPTDKKQVPIRLKKTLELAIDAMNAAQYDVMNLGPTELTLGSSFFRQTFQNASFPVVASNAGLKEGTEPLGKPYAILQCDEITVGVIGIMPANTFALIKPTIKVDDIKIVDPEAAVAQLLPEVRRQAQAVILLSQCNDFLTRRILMEAPGIDLAIRGNSGSRITTAKTSSCESTGVTVSRGEGATLTIPVYTASSRGAELGSVIVNIDDQGAVTVRGGRVIKIDDSVKPDLRVTAILGNDIAQTLKNRAARPRVGQK